MATRYNAKTVAQMIQDDIVDSDDGGEYLSDEESDSDHADEVEPDETVATESELDDSSSDEESHTSASHPTKRRMSSNNSRNPPTTEPDLYNSRSGMKWSSAPPPAIVKTAAANIVRNRPGVTNAGKVQDIGEAFNLFVTDDILMIVVRETNRYAAQHCSDISNGQNPPAEPLIWNPIDIVELKAVIGLLLIAGADKSSHVSTRDLWSKAGKPVYKSVMNVVRLKSILRFMRFDDRRTRDQRQQTDKLAAFHYIWIMFLDRLPMMYCPDKNMTVDEQLVSFRGRCSFKQYIPSKPGKYGLKIFWNCDSKSSYPLKGEIYLGRQPGAARDKKSRRATCQTSHTSVAKYRSKRYM